MGIGQYIKEIGRGKDGARALSRAQARDLFGQVLDGTVTDLEIGGFCLAMRIKGETPEEMAGFLDAAQARLHHLPALTQTTVVLPSYNGARKLPCLTALLALLVARAGRPVVVHGLTQDPGRTTTASVMQALGLPVLGSVDELQADRPCFCPVEVLSPALRRLLDVRRVVGLRNPAHSLVKLMNPCSSKSLIVSSYTHPEYAISMAASFELMGSHALLLRGTEGEAVADARRVPQMDGFTGGVRTRLQGAQTGPLVKLPELPGAIDADSTAAYIRAVMAGEKPVPPPVALQLEHILRLTQSS